MKLSFLYGITFSDWWSMLRENRFRIHFSCLHNAFTLTLMSLYNSFLARREPSIPENVNILDPIFILGHWRSGTTHLHYILNEDPQFMTPNTYQVCYPHSFLGSEETHGGKIARFIPATRPQDNMALSLLTPNEDDIALSSLGLPTAYLAWAWPHRMEHYLRFLSFREATIEKKVQWQNGYRQWIMRLQSKHPNRRLVLKSPANTARIPLLLEMFPNAKFIHIHRAPDMVYQSSQHLYRVYAKTFAFLQSTDTSNMGPRIRSMYREMYLCYFRDRPGIPEENIVEISFTELEENALETISRIYRTLSLENFPTEAIQRYLSEQKSYQKNEHPPLCAEERKLLQKHWGFVYDALGYPRTSALK